MKNWIKVLGEIFIIIFLFSLLAEVIFGITYGYETRGQGKFKDGLNIQGEIEYTIRNIDINGEDWEANFSDLSEFHTIFYITSVSYNFTVQTSILTIFPNGSGSIEFNGITNNSEFNSITFHKGRTWVELTLPQNLIIGIIGNTTYSDELELTNIIFITDTESINASSGRGTFFLLGNNENIRYNISLGEDYHVTTYTQIGDTISIKGDLQAHNFEGVIGSNGKLYFSGNPRLSGEIKLKILQNPETYYNHEGHKYDWELEIEGEDIVVEGFGIPFWGIGLILSSIPTIIIVVYHINKNIIKGQEKSGK